MAGGYGSAGDLRTINGGQPSISADWKDEPEYGDISCLVDFFVKCSSRPSNVSSLNVPQSAQPSLGLRIG